MPISSPTWNFLGAYSFEVDFAKREQWFSRNASPVLGRVRSPAASTTYNAQKPKISLRWQPIDPKYIGALTLRGSYTEAFHAPTLLELNPAGSQNFPLVVDPFSNFTLAQVEERINGNPFLQPETAYEWTIGAVYTPKWLKGLTVSAVGGTSTCAPSLQRWDPSSLSTTVLTRHFPSGNSDASPTGFPSGSVWWAGFGSGSFGQRSQL